MENLHFNDNIKVHFAGIESLHYLDAIKEMGVQYALYSAYPFIFKKLFSKTKRVTENDLAIPTLLDANMKHVT